VSLSAKVTLYEGIGWFFFFFWPSFFQEGVRNHWLGTRHCKHASVHRLGAQEIKIKIKIKIKLGVSFFVSA